MLAAYRVTTSPSESCSGTSRLPTRNLGALQILQYSNSHAHLSGNPADRRYASGVLVVGAVREIHAGNVHANLNEFFEHCWLLAGGAYGGDNFCVAIYTDLSKKILVI